MKAKLLDGRAIAEQIHTETQERVHALKNRGIIPGLTFIRVGEDPASQVYVGMKEKKAKGLGIRSETKILAAETSPQELEKLIDQLNRDEQVHGILIQSPIGPQFNEAKVFASVSPQKDVDGFHPENFGKMLLGDKDGFRSCTPAGVHELLIRSGVSIEGAEVVILGRGNIVGKPMAAILMQKARHANATITVLHSRSRGIKEHCRRADIIIAAMGQAEFVQADMIREGAVVVDVGVNRVKDPSTSRGYRLVGDVAFESISEVAGYLTPNPGGVGPMTIAMLMSNTVKAAEQQTTKKVSALDS